MFIKVTPIGEGLSDLTALYINTDKLVGIGVEEMDDGDHTILIMSLDEETGLNCISIRENVDELPLDIMFTK